MAETSDDMIVEVLAKLPVKSLLRFKCVCKTWYSTISDPQFCNKLHWMRPSVLICQNSLEFSSITIESLLTAKNKSPTPLSLPWETEDQARDMDPPLSDYRDKDGNYFLGSCNGLVCVNHKSSHTGRDDLILWNPSTREFRRLPHHPPRCYRDRKTCFFYHYYVWFGYDESIHDYKLVWVDYSESHPKESKLYVFTLKSNTWRSTDDRRLPHRKLSKDNDPHNPRSIGVLSNGAIHWRTCTHSDLQMVILALDLATETFQVLDFANHPFDPRGGGSCLVGGVCSCMYDAGMSLHIVKEYGCQGIVLPKWGKRIYYPTLFSKEESKEILTVFDDGICQAHRFVTYGDRIVKFRMEEGGEKVRFDETLLVIPNGSPMMKNIPNGRPMMKERFRCRNNIVLHRESLVSIAHAMNWSRGEQEMSTKRRRC